MRYRFKSKNFSIRLFSIAVSLVVLMFIGTNVCAGELELIEPGTLIVAFNGDMPGTGWQDGRLIGLGFQIWDDCLDLLADEKKLGKPVGSDIKNGKRTLMVVHALERLEGKEREDFLSVLGNQNASQGQVNQAIQNMNSTGSIEYSKNMALDFAKRAKELLEVLPESESRGILAEIAEYMVRRES